ncbi:MAG TPA: hypothetical protein VHA75_16955, partial [Rugosimonospora sp.]|nr:hypothetical protein [Rugosimonospora sp.]
MADADPDLPDPAKLRDLAARWQAIANQLADLAATVTSSVSGTNWTGDGKNAAMTAAGGVSTVIGQAATNAQAMADGLNDFAGKIEDALKAEEASFWATLIGALLDIASLGLAGIFTAAIKALSELLVEVLTAVGAELETATVLANFAANAFVFGGFSAISNITTQLSSEAIAGEHLHVDPLSVGISVLDGGLTAGLIGPAFTGGRNVGAVPHGDIGEVPALGGQHGVPNVVDEVNPNAVRGSGIRLEPPPAVDVGNVNVGKIGADGGLVGAVRAPTPASTVSRALPGVTDEGVALPTTVR